MFDGLMPSKLTGKKADVFFFDELGPVLDGPLPKYFVEWKKELVQEYTFKNVDIGKTKAFTVNIEPHTCNCHKCLGERAFRMQEQMLRQFYERQPVWPEPVKAFKILEDPKSWTKNTMEVMRGKQMMRCIMGALAYKWGNRAIDMANDARKIAEVLRKKYNIQSMYMDYSRLVASWNDAPETNHKMVLEVLKEANV